ncbi:MAG: ABC transporter substrate-binding protein [Acetivibrio sp.]
MKKRIAWILFLIIAMGVLAGCGKKEKEQTKQEVSKGRYIEEEIMLPEGEEVIQMLQNKDGKLEIYTETFEKKREFRKYVMGEDGKWKQEKADWIHAAFENFLFPKGYDGSIEKIILGQDGAYYTYIMAYKEKESRSYIFRSADGETNCSQVEIPFLNEAPSNNNDYTMYPWITDIEVLENGNVLLNDGTEDKVLLFSPKGEKLFELEIEGRNDSMEKGNDIWVGGNTIAGFKKNAAEILIVNGETGEEEKNIEISQKETGAGLSRLSDGTMILADKKGIHRLQEGGSLWETVVDGELNSMSMPTEYLGDFFAEEGETETYYARYTNESGSTLIHYTFDEKTVSVPEEELTVYSLRENATVRQAISLFQRKNQNARIKYVVAMGEEEENPQEYIKALNTEILGGNGADVLILDGLPADSYEKNGVLGDIHSLCAEAGVLPNILAAYTREGKTYQIPIKMAVPVIMGTKEVVESAKDLSSIINYAKKNKENPFVKDIGYKKVAEEFLKMEYASLISKENTLNKKAFQTYLENISYLKESGCAASIPELEGRFESSPFYLKEKKTNATWERLFSISNLFVAQTLTKGTENEMGSLHNSFYSLGVVGINGATKKIKLAEDFVSIILSFENQKINVYDGLPVEEKAWDNLIKKEDKDSSFGTSYTMEDGTVASLDGEYPKKEMREKFADISKKAAIPIQMEDTMATMIITEMEGFFNGNMDIQRTVQAVESKVNRYLSEQESW